MNPIDEFSERLYLDWLPSFCDARGPGLTPEGFRDDNLGKLSEIDARWFLRALDAGYVTEDTGFFVSQASRAKEQILWGGPVNDQTRKIYLWLEPIITVGALAQLVDEYGWPPSQVGLQSEPPWPFDLMGYDTDGVSELLACEVKKSDAETVRLINEMQSFSAAPALGQEPDKPAAKNAYRKVVGIRRSWPALFWALGPAGSGQLFRIEREADGDIFSMVPAPLEKLRYRSK